MLCRVVAFVVAFGLLLGPAHAQTSLLRRDLSASEVATALTAALQRVQIHLHNHGSINNGSVHAANASSIKWRALQGPGTRTRFTLPDASTVVLGRRYGYYLNHVRGDGIFVAPQPDGFTMTVLLKSVGPAMIGKCVKQGATPAPCETLGDGVMPGIGWQDGRIDADLVPVKFGRSLAFEVRAVRIGGAFEVGPACSWPIVGSRLCGLISRRTEALRGLVAAEVKSVLNADNVKRDIATAVREHLDTNAEVPILGVSSVAMADGVVRVGFGFGR